MDSAIGRASCSVALGEKDGDEFLIDFVDAGPTDEVRERRGPEEPVGSAMVIQGADAGIIAGKDHATGLGIPDGQAPVSDNVEEPRRAMPAVCLEGKGAVGAIEGDRILAVEIRGIVQAPVPGAMQAFGGSRPAMVGTGIAVRRGVSHNQPGAAEKPGGKSAGSIQSVRNAFLVGVASRAEVEVEDACELAH